MKLGKVIGTIVATRKQESLKGFRLLVVQPLDQNLEKSGRPLIAADAVALAGYGDTVFLVTSHDATQSFDDVFTPVDAAIVGIVDSVHSIDSEVESGKQ